MEGTSASFPANYVTLKDLQERWLKRKQDEEDEEKLRKLREEEESIPRNEKETKNHQPKSKNPTRSAQKSSSSPAAAASHSQGPKKGAKRREKILLKGFNAKECKAIGFDGKGPEAIGAKSEISSSISCRKKAMKRGSARSRIPPSESESVVEVENKRAEKEGKGLESGRGDRAEDICRHVADLSVAGGFDRRGGRISRGGRYGGRRSWSTARVSPSVAGMVWVRKKTDC